MALGGQSTEVVTGRNRSCSPILAPTRYAAQTSAAVAAILSRGFSPLAMLPRWYSMCGTRRRPEPVSGPHPAQRRALALDAVRLGRIEAARAGQRPQHPPGAPRGEQPVRLAAEGADELLRQRRATDVHGPLQVARHVFDAVLRHDAADPDREPERDRRERDADCEEHRVVGEAVREVPAEKADDGIDDGGDRD